MLPTTTCVILNPRAAAGRVGARRDQIESRLREILGPVEVRPTEALGDAARLARQAISDGATTLLSLGGDGTHSEVVHGILTSSAPHGSITLGVLPAGTGGDFRRLLENSDTWETAALGLPGASDHGIDAGRIRVADEQGREQVRYFVNICSFGVGGLVARVVNSSSKRLGARATFALGVFRAILQYQPASVRLRVDGEDRGTFCVTNIAVGNGRFFGGGMMVTPGARLADGLLDVTVIEHHPLLETIVHFSDIYSGRHLARPGVHTFRGSVIEAEPVGGTSAFIELDGEASGVIPIRVEVVPNALRLLQPRRDVL
jgi:YegS/Rv2252/BmrU family lipid kinase